MLTTADTELLAWCLFAAMLFTVIGYAVAYTRDWPITRHQAFWYAVNYFIARVYWRGKVSGPLPLPPGQGAIIVCNHRAPMDPAFIQIATRRAVHWMVAKEYTTHWTVGWFFRMAEIIPVGRGGIDTAATKAAIRYAQRGGLVGMFPEGRINVTRRCLLPGRLGAALIALRARVPVLPCFVRGTRFAGSVLGTVLRPAKVEMTFGRPIDISEFYGREDDREAVEEITRRILAEIARLGGCHDYVPELAGRSYKPDLATDR